VKTPNAVTKRLDLSKQVVDRAKLAYANAELEEPPKNREKIAFRATLDYAIKEFLPKIESKFEELGLIKQENQQRQRPVSLATWERLNETAQKYDISRIQTIRCALELLARTQDESEEPSS